MHFWFKIRNSMPNITQFFYFIFLFFLKNIKFLMNNVKFFNEKFQSSFFWWNLRFHACDQKLLLVAFYVKPYLACWGRFAAPVETVNASKSSIDEKAWLVRCWGQLYSPTGESKLGTSYLFLYGDAVLEAVEVVGLKGRPTWASEK